MVKAASSKPVFTEAQFEEIKKIIGEALKSGATVEPEPPRFQSDPTLFGEVWGVFKCIPGWIKSTMAGLVSELALRNELIPSAAAVLFMQSLIFGLVPLLCIIDTLVPGWIIGLMFLGWITLGYPTCYGVILYLTKKFGNK